KPIANVHATDSAELVRPAPGPAATFECAGTKGLPRCKPQGAPRPANRESQRPSLQAAGSARRSSRERTTGPATSEWCLEYHWCAPPEKPPREATARDRRETTRAVPETER